eukprot:scaffold221660_cov31-Tisochrysis_lutea.AAC.1
MERCWPKKRNLRLQVALSYRGIPEREIGLGNTEGGIPEVEGILEVGGIPVKVPSSPTPRSHSSPLPSLTTISLVPTPFSCMPR